VCALGVTYAVHFLYECLILVSPDGTESQVQQSACPLIINTLALFTNLIRDRGRKKIPAKSGKGGRGGGVMGGSTKWKVPIKICFTLPGTFGAIGDHMRVYSSALDGPCARLHNNFY
jgi:hypothetical protein